MLQVGREKPPAGTGCAWDGPTDGTGLDKDVHPCRGWPGEAGLGKKTVERSQGDHFCSTEKIKGGT